MGDMLTGRPVYVPSGDVARAITRAWMYSEVKRLMETGNIKVSLGDMTEDGTCPIYVTAESETFDLSAALDAPTIAGTVWVEDRASTPVHIWYSFPAQEHTAAETNYAETAPVDFWTRYGRR